MPGDYDGDGLADAAIYRPSSGYWYIKKSTNPAASWAIPWGGFDGDVPLVVNFTTSTNHNICIYRPSNGTWYFWNPSTSYGSSVTYGTSGDVPVPQDRTAGGISEPAVFRPWEGIWYNLSYGADAFGTIGDKPRSRRTFSIIAPNNSGNEDSKKK